MRGGAEVVARAPMPPRWPVTRRPRGRGAKEDGGCAAKATGGPQARAGSPVRAVRAVLRHRCRWLVATAPVASRLRGPLNGSLHRSTRCPLDQRASRVGPPHLKPSRARPPSPPTPPPAVSSVALGRALDDRLPTRRRPALPFGRPPPLPDSERPPSSKQRSRRHWRRLGSSARQVARPSARPLLPQAWTLACSAPRTGSRWSQAPPGQTTERPRTPAAAVTHVRLSLAVL